MEMVATIIDGLWYARNMQKFRNEDIDDDIVISMATAIGCNTNKKLRKPNAGVYKDVDGTIMAAAWKVKGFANAATAEAMAMQKAMEFAHWC
ncbi:hypothetical protein TSUD_102410 [Trifolium subterraneum]|uniref:Uncharacterized protein n=1 Tax=Trifolium subterraneum TaxID=3900 RepID=A0A2Z6M984_TRISU|nr:hypothetical protein TSUD_102410 [Trifolium subterraneum]